MPAKVLARRSWGSSRKKAKARHAPSGSLPMDTCMADCSTQTWAIEETRHLGGHLDRLLGRSRGMFHILAQADLVVLRSSRLLVPLLALFSVALVPFQVWCLLRLDNVEKRWRAEVPPFENAVPTQVVLALGSIFLLHNVPTVAAARVVTFLVFAWFAAWAKALGVAVFREVRVADVAAMVMFYACNVVGFISGFCAWMAWARLFILRAAVLHSVLQNTGGVYLRGFRCVLVAIPLLLGAAMSAAAASALMYGTLPGDSGISALVQTWIVVCGALFVATCLLLYLTLRIYVAGFGVATKNAAELKRQGDLRLASECRFAARVARWQACGLTIGTLGMLGRNLWWAAAFDVGFLREVKRWHWIGILVEDVTVTIAALWLVGCFSGALASSRRRCKVSSRTQEKWYAARRRWIEAREQLSLGWREKVNELAHRGFSLGALLHFYRGLGKDYFPHFISHRHTTADVVRHAIVPLSAKQACAMAEIMMHFVPTRPQKMVTHNWGNNFRDLVAAIVADALGEAVFGRIAELLDRDIGTLERWLRDAGHLGKTYWVCAFSVNQHITMCHTNEGCMADTVTGEPYPLCDCSSTKCTSSRAPSACEVNKFDDMMRHLSAMDPAFGQVVAVDSRFNIFSRAWCVAELAAANEMGMKQEIKFTSVEALNKHETALRGLRIEDMDATRPEDKALILGRIEDPERFNRELQRLLFDDLLPAWHSIDGEEQMLRLAALVRWEAILSPTAREPVLYSL